ncbi:MAG: pilus assembly PilX N-terminal domain-containing protein, partial [Vicinamibacterales bacterium]
MKRSLVANESGIALVTAILVLMVASALMAGMFAALLADRQSHATDRDQSVAYAAAHAGLEKLTASLAGLFNTDFSPSAAQITAAAATPPAIPGFEYTSPGGALGSGYAISFTPDPCACPNAGNPLALPNTDITTGPFEGFKGLVTPYTITVTAKSTTGNSEVRLRRELQTVAVPVFQFGIFGEKALGFHAGPDFDFGGRVHTNQTLFLAAGTGNTLTMRDKITAFT